MRESEIEFGTCKNAEKYGWRSIKLNGSGDKGKPDRLFMRGPPPQLIFVEFKKSNAKLGALQVIWRRWLKAMGFKHYVIDNLADGIKLFEE